MTDVTRRSFGQVLGMAALPLPTTLVAASVAPLDLVSREGQFAAWMKVFVSLARTRVWYWYTGTIDAAVPGGPVLPLFGVDTLIRRDIVPLGGNHFRMEMFEGSYFHALDDPTPMGEWHNPLNGRDVQPFHYREGPYLVGYDPSGPYDMKTNAPYPGAPPFITKFHRAGDQLWFSRDYYIDAPHPLSVTDWPLESSGSRQTVGSFATHWASYTDVANPLVKTARSAFHYEAFMDWFPWMLMGQATGRMAWRGAGTKLASIADLPATARAGFLKTHPRLFDDRPWTDFANQYTDFRKLRKPSR